jgi:hypothetical protein
MNGDKIQTVWAVFTDENYLDSIWVTKANAEAYVQSEEEKDPRCELHIWETPLNNWGSKFGGVGA